MIKNSFWLIIIAGCFLLHACNRKEVQERLDKCNKLKVGMKYQEVLNIMGIPKSIAVFSEDTVWLYSWNYTGGLLNTAPAPVRCYIDASTGVVTRVICGE